MNGVSILCNGVQKLWNGHCGPAMALSRQNLSEWAKTVCIGITSYMYEAEEAVVSSLYREICIVKRISEGMH